MKMEKAGSVIPDSLTKIMPPAPSSHRCSVHDLEVPDEHVTIGARTFSVNGTCQACVNAGTPMDSQTQPRDKENARDVLRRQVGVPERYLRASFGDFREETEDQQRVGEQLRTFVAGGWKGSPGLLLLGNVGTAKTLLGAALVNHWLDQHGARSARFYTLLELVRRVKATWSQDSFETEILAYQRLRHFPLLVIDEIGVQWGTPPEKTIFTEVINHRYNALHPTVLIGNLTIEECTDVVGDRVMDRFRDGGHLLAFTWPSQRGAKPSA
jgi:DNA replication protein DnaC